VVNADELSGLAQASVANRLFHVPSKQSRDLVDRVYRGHVGPTGNALSRVRSGRPWHTTSVDDWLAADA
jgi:hypothetical protein